MARSRLLDLWSQHEAAAFPRELHDREHSGVDIVLLDAEIAGCVSSALTRGALDPRRRGALQALAPIAASAARETPAGEARMYLDRLAEIAHLVLDTDPE